MKRTDLIYSTSASSASRIGGTQSDEMQIVSRPASMLHGKEVGTSLTLCGESALTWQKHWDIPFASCTAGRCPRCVHVLAERLQKGTGR